LDSETTILISIATLSTLYFALITITQIVFQQVELYTDALKEQRIRLILSKIEELTDNTALFNTVIATARITVGAIVSTIPDDGCEDLCIDGKHYKECEGVLFEPVYKGDDVQYEVVEIKKK